MGERHLQIKGSPLNECSRGRSTGKESENAQLTDSTPASGIFALRVVLDPERAPDQFGRIVDRRPLHERQRSRVDEEGRRRLGRRNKPAEWGCVGGKVSATARIPDLKKGTRMRGRTH